jgi:putative lipase involved disintegration of autophagic bodies
MTEVTRLKALYPEYQVKTTGHSLGGALALLT